MLLPVLDDLETYEQLATRCLILDTGLKRIEEMNPKRRARTNEKPSTSAPAIPRTIRLVTPSPAPRLSLTPDRISRPSAPPEAPITYYNYYKLGYFASFYL